MGMRVEGRGIAAHMRRAAAIAACAMLAWELTGCATKTNVHVETDEPVGAEAARDAADMRPTAVDAPDARPLEITESGWWDKDSYVHYGIMVKNPNESYRALGARVKVTLYDADDGVIDEREDEIALVEAGQTIGFAQTLGDGCAPTRVEISLVEDSVEWAAAEGAVPPLIVEEFSEEDKLYFRYEISGMLTNAMDAYASTVDLSVILRDENGSIVAGYPGEAYHIKAGQTKSFMVTLHTAPDHASVEVYAQPRGW